MFGITWKRWSRHGSLVVQYSLLQCECIPFLSTEAGITVVWMAEVMMYCKYSWEHLLITQCEGQPGKGWGVDNRTWPRVHSTVRSVTAPLDNCHKKGNRCPRWRTYPPLLVLATIWIFHRFLWQCQAKAWDLCRGDRKCRGKKDIRLWIYFDATSTIFYVGFNHSRALPVL